MLYNKIKIGLAGIFLALSLILLISCGQTDNSANQITDPSYSISGYIQKGPFVSGSSIKILELDNNLNPTGNTFETFTNDDFGSFIMGSTIKSQFVEVIATGYYFDETLGELSASTLTLRALSDLSLAPVTNINLLTTLEIDRIKYLITQKGNNYSTAVTQAESEILQVFNLGTTGINSFNQMDISKIGDSNAILLAISAILQTGNSVAKLSELISKISLDIKEDGILDRQTTITQIQNNATLVDETAVKSNLVKRYDDLGLTVEIPDFESKTNLIDKNIAGFIISAITQNTTEASGVATFTVALSGRKPNADITFDITSDDSSEGTVSPSSLIFTPDNWQTEQTVTVTGVDDNIIDPGKAYNIILQSVVSTDLNYNGLDPADVSVINSDNDSPDFVISSISENTTEAGTTATFTVLLTAEPSADVMIPLSSDDLTEATVSPASLTFTAANWNIAQTVTATGVNDADIDGNISYAIILGVISSNDLSYSGLDPSDVTAINDDNDPATFTVSSTNINTTEAGGTATFTVKPDRLITENVIIALSSSDLTEGTVSPTLLTFTPADWNTTQSVTVTGVDDATLDGPVQFTITLGTASSADPEYNGINPNDKTLYNIDDEWKLPDMGQTTGYTTTFGEDADYTINPPSYTDNTDGTITDNNTGLIWQQIDDNTQRTWADAGTYCTGLSLGGQTDWRLPTARELNLINNLKNTSPSINTTYFTGVNSSYYWSSTVYASDDLKAWNVHFSEGLVSYSSKTSTDYVRCVSGASLTVVFMDNSDNTVTDLTASLMWQQTDDNTQKTWEAALTYCEGLSLINKSDWRLPNRNELETLVDYSKIFPSINTTYFPNTASFYLTSTTNANTSLKAWSIDFRYGYISYFPKSLEGNIRCVRSIL